MESYERLEKNWAEFNGLDPKGMVACSSGSAALVLALEAMELPAGSSVVTSDFNMIAVPRAIAIAGLQPVFVDCRNDLLMDPSLACQAWGDRTSAFVVVHVYGRRCDMNLLAWPAMNHGQGVMLVEDLAEAHGVRPHPDADAATWSFYKNKIVAGEEGGAVWFKDPKHAKLARQLRCLGFNDAHDFNHVPRGHNYRMANCLAEKILVNLDVLPVPELPHVYPPRPGGRVVDHFVEKRREREGWYNSLFPQEWRMPYRDAPWVMDIRIPGMTSETQTRIVRNLNVAGIRARFFFKPMSKQEEFRGCKVYGNGRAEVMAREGIYLPIDPSVTKEEVERSVKIIVATIRS